MNRSRIGLVLIAVFFCSMAVPLFAQEETGAVSSPRNEIYAGYGSISAITIVGALLGALSSISSSGETTGSMIGPVQLGYNYYFNEHFSLGLLSTAEYQTFVTADSSKTTSILFGTVQLRPNVQWGWEKVKIYHGLSIGALCIYSGQTTSSGQTTDISWSWMFNVIPLGIKVNIVDGLNIFADCAFGSAGFVNAGLSYQF